MPLLPRPRAIQRDDGWVDAWIGLQSWLERSRRVIREAASGPCGDEAADEDLVYAMLALVCLADTVDRHIEELAGDTSAPAMYTTPPPVDLLR